MELQAQDSGRTRREPCWVKEFIAFIPFITSSLNYTKQNGESHHILLFCDFNSKHGKNMEFHVCWPFLPEKELLGNSSWLWMANRFGFISNSNTVESKNLAWIPRAFGLCSALEILLKNERRGIENIYWRKKWRQERGQSARHMAISCPSFWQNSSPQMHSGGQRSNFPASPQKFSYCSTF